MEIKPAGIVEAPILAKLISESNKDVAEMFGLTQTNCPKHPSFCTTEWFASDFTRGEIYFIAYENNEAVACVATEYPSEEMAYLNRLAVLPVFRKRGIGEKLVSFIIELARQRGVKTVSIGIIGEHDALQNWYSRLGFIASETKHFPHLPFSVKYMAYSI